MHFDFDNAFLRETARQLVRIAVLIAGALMFGAAELTSNALGDEGWLQIIDVERLRQVTKLRTSTTSTAQWIGNRVLIKPSGAPAELFDPDSGATERVHDQPIRAASVAHRRGVPLIAFYHSNFPQLAGRRLGPGVQKFIEWYVRLTYEQCEQVLAPSRHMCDYLREIGVRHATCQPLGVDVEMFSPTRAGRDPTRERQSTAFSSFSSLRSSGTSVLWIASAAIAPSAAAAMASCGPGTMSPAATQLRTDVWYASSTMTWP